MPIKLTILCENSVNRVRPYPLLGEHGFACHIKTDQGEFLFDTGGGFTLQNNADLMGIDFSKLKGLMFSHGHFDHTGGLKQVLSLKSPLPIYAHPDLFSEHYSNNGGKTRNIGIAWSRKELEELGAVFHLSAEPFEVASGLLLSGKIPRTSAFETGDPNLLALDSCGCQVTDPLNDDLSLFISTEKGLVILLGCAHAGIINIIEHAINVTGQRKVHMVLGGTHLKFCSDSQMKATLDRLEELGVERIGASHCTGLEGALTLAQRFGNRFFAASVGVELEL